MVVKVIFQDDGTLTCEHCGGEILCNDCGDMPDICPCCGSELAYGG